MGNALLAFGAGAAWIIANPHSVLFLGFGITLIIGGAIELCAQRRGWW